MFSHFFDENSKWPPFLKIFSKVGVVISLHTLGVENFDEIALSLTVKEILCFATFGKKFEKSKTAAIFENFFKSVCSILFRYPGGRKFRRNHSISNG